MTKEAVPAPDEFTEPEAPDFGGLTPIERIGRLRGMLPDVERVEAPTTTFDEENQPDPELAASMARVAADQKAAEEQSDTAKARRNRHSNAGWVANNAQSREDVLGIGKAAK